MKKSFPTTDRAPAAHAHVPEARERTAASSNRADDHTTLRWLEARRRLFGDESGDALDAIDRRRFEDAFGVPLGDVRVHTSPTVSARLRADGAVAATAGGHVGIDTSRVAPGTEAGTWLLSHELAHVLQQRDARPVDGASAPLEAQASHAADRVASGGISRLPSHVEVPAVLHATYEELLRAERIRLERELAAEGERVFRAHARIQASGGDWAAKRAGVTKHWYNVREELAVARLRESFPGRTIYEQVTLVGVETPDGKFIEAKPRRIADWAELRGNDVILGDFKTETEYLHSVEGGPTSEGVSGRFNPSSKIGLQLEKEDAVIREAINRGGRIRVRAQAIGSQHSPRPVSVELTVDPAHVSRSRVTTYERLPEFTDEPRAGRTPPARPPRESGGREPGAPPRTGEPLEGTPTSGREPSATSKPTGEPSRTGGSSPEATKTARRPHVTAGEGVSTGPSTARAAAGTAAHETAQATASEARAMAGELAKTAKSETRWLRFGRAAAIAAQLLEAIGQLQQADELTDMAEKALAGKPVFFAEALKKADAFHADALALQREHEDFRERLSEADKQLTEVLHGGNLQAMFAAADAMTSVRADLDSVRGAAVAGITRANESIRVLDKRIDYANQIMANPAVLGIGSAFGMEGKIAGLPLAVRELEGLRGTFDSARTALRAARDGSRQDVEHLRGWERALVDEWKRLYPAAKR